MSRGAIVTGLLLLLTASPAALAQGNDTTTSGIQQSPGPSAGKVFVGANTTDATTTGQSGPQNAPYSAGAAGQPGSNANQAAGASGGATSAASGSGQPSGSSAPSSSGSSGSSAMTPQARSGQNGSQLRCDLIRDQTARQRCQSKAQQSKSQPKNQH